MLIFDRFAVGDTLLTPEGYLSVPSRIAQTEIQECYGFEFSLEPVM